MTLPQGAVAVAVAGEALVDELPSGMRPGGSPYNVAIGLARLGIPASFHGAVGSDEPGRLLRRHASDSGVDLAQLRQVDGPTMRAAATIDQAGVPRYTFNVPDCAAMQWQPAPGELSDSPALLHVGSIASWLSPAAEAIARLVDVGGAHGALLSFDPNVRPALLPDRDARDAAISRIDHLLSRAGLVKVSAEDLAWLAPASAPADTAAGWSRRCPGPVILTDGAAPATAFVDGREVIRRPTVPAQVRDTVGAGDAFMAAVLADLIRHWPDAPSDAQSDARSRVRALAADAGSLADLLDAGHAAAALTCERIGADPPTAAELDADLARRR